MFALFKKELSYYLKNPVGYIVVFLFAVFSVFLFVKDIFVIGIASMQSFFSVIPWLLLIFVPAITMRSIAEEKRINTIETLLTLPLSETQIILAKFFATLSLAGIALLLTVGLPISLSFLSKIYLPEVLAGYVGCLFLASSYIAVSLFFSAQTKNQVVAFLLSAISLFFISSLSSDFLAGMLPKFVQDSLSYYAPLYHYQNFTKGVMDIRSIIYFLSGTAVFLFLTILSLEKRD